MGSFYATCSITKTTLSNQKTCFQLMIPSRLRINDKNGVKSLVDFRTGMRRSGVELDEPVYPSMFEKGLQVSNEGALAWFIPFAFPIRGEYYDYGQIDSIKRDKNVEMLEEFFNLSIENIMTAASRDGWISELELPESKGRSYDRKREDLIGIDGTPIKNIYILEHLNSTYIREEIYDFLCEGYDELSIKKGGNSWDNPFAEIYESIVDITEQESMSEEELDTHLEKVKAKFDSGEITKDEHTKQVVKLIRATHPSTSERTYLSGYSSDPDFIRIMKPKMADFETDYRKQFQFIRTLGWQMNYVLMPSIYGSQDVNFPTVKSMNRELDKLLTEDMLDYDYDYDEDEQTMRKRRDTLKEVSPDDSTIFSEEYVMEKYDCLVGHEVMHLDNLRDIIEDAFKAGQKSKVEPQKQDNNV